MRFARFGVMLERLQRGHLETVRRWRNSDWVRPHMLHQAEVGPEDQERWFTGLEPLRDWYFLAHAGSAPFALFHVKGVDWSRKWGEAGGFVGHPTFIGRPEPAQATLALMDFAFLLLELDALEAQYRTRLPKVVRFNAQLGYRILHEADGFVRARVTAEEYFAGAAQPREAAAVVHGTRATLSEADPWLASRVDPARARRRHDFELRLT